MTLPPGHARQAGPLANSGLTAGRLQVWAMHSLRCPLSQGLQPGLTKASSCTGKKSLSSVLATLSLCSRPLLSLTLPCSPSPPRPPCSVFRGCLAASSTTRDARRSSRPQWHSSDAGPLPALRAHAGGHRGRERQRGPHQSRLPNSAGPPGEAAPRYTGGSPAVYHTIGNHCLSVPRPGAPPGAGAGTGLL